MNIDGLSDDNFEPIPRRIARRAQLEPGGGEVVPFPVNPGVYWRRRAHTCIDHEETLVLLYLVILDLEEKYERQRRPISPPSDADQLAFPWAASG